MFTGASKRGIGRRSVAGLVETRSRPVGGRHGCPFYSDGADPAASSPAADSVAYTDSRGHPVRPSDDGNTYRSPRR